MTSNIHFNRSGFTVGVVLWVYASCGSAAQVIVPAPPVLGTGSYILMDFHSGAVLVDKDADKPAAPASITKLMTAYLVYEALAEGTVNLDDEVEISERAWKTAGSRMFIEVGATVRVEDLLFGVVVQSGNDASVALAEHIAGSETTFISMMNKKAKALGMTGSNFTNATGLPMPNHRMSAHDIALLSRALIRNFPDHYAMYSVREFTYNNIKQYNRNRLLWRNRSVDGLKTGHTQDAGYCLAASARQGDMRLISVVLGSSSDKQRAAQISHLLDYGFRFFMTHRLYKKMQPMYEVRVWGGEPKHLQLGVREDFYVTVPRGGQNKLDIESHMAKELTAPIMEAQPLGVIKVSYEDKFSREEPLVALSPVVRAGVMTRMVDSFLKLF